MLDSHIILNVFMGIFYYKLVFGILKVFLKCVIKELEKTIEEEEMQNET